MSKIISNISRRLQEVILVLQGEGISVDGVYVIAVFFRDFSDTNALIANE